MTTTATVDIRRADDRAKTAISWLDSKHSFSFGHNYDPTNTHHGPDSDSAAHNQIRRSPERASGLARVCSDFQQLRKPFQQFLFCRGRYA